MLTWSITGRNLLDNTFLNRVLIGLLLFAVAMITGVIGYMIIEGYTVVEAIYMTVITVSTVGFKEVRPLTSAGQLFTSGLIIFNIGIFAYAIGIITSFVVEGELRNIFKSIKVTKTIEQLSDHVIVCGCGRVGTEVGHELIHDKIPFITIERDPAVVEAARNRGWLVITGDATKEEVLNQAQLKRARAVIATLPKDVENVYIVLSVKEHNKNLNVISRSSSEGSKSKLEYAGADHIIMPEVIGGGYMANLVSKPDLVEFLNRLNLVNSVNIHFEECSFDSLPPDMKNKSIRELDVGAKNRCQYHWSV